jgi:catechol 2,3-dioxygenase-like lactoylglutathione lyase family enzyme
MKKLVTILSFAVLALLPLSRAAAQAPLVAPGDVTMGHVHLAVTEVDANKKFWIAMGGTPVTLGSGATAIEGVSFGNVRVLLRKADNVGPAMGSGINHIGFYVPNVKAAIAKWNAMGLKTAPGRDDQQSFVWTPGDLLRVEILEMPGQTAPIVFHHVHFFETANAAGGLPEMEAWYTKMFATMPGKRAGYDTGTVPGGEMTFTKSDTPVVPTAGRAVDHIGFYIKNLEAYCKTLEANGVKLDMPYTKRPDLGLAIAFITDPWGTRIELNEPLTQSSEVR